jgi:DNA-binding MarR family transcriptional regulator
LMALPESGALTYAELHRAVPDLSHVALSRHVRLLCGRSKLRQAGSNAWADQRPDPADARKMLVSLTRRGRALQQTVVKALNAPRPQLSARRAVKSARQTTRRTSVIRRR